MERKKGKGDRCHFELLLESREERERAEDNLFPPPRRRRLRTEFYPTCKVSLLILKRGTFKQCTSAVSCAELKIEFSRIKTGPGRRV